MTMMKKTIENKKVRFEYTILETYEAGIVLIGNEVKAIHNGHCNLTDTYCYFNNNELFVKNISISSTFLIVFNLYNINFKRYELLL